MRRKARQQMSHKDTPSGPTYRQCGDRGSLVSVFSVSVTASKDEREAIAALLCFGGNVCFGT